MRTKEHPAKPMTVDDALYEMELVGHDFFLFHDKQSDTAVRGVPQARLRLRTDSALLSRPTWAATSSRHVVAGVPRWPSPRMDDAEDSIDHTRGNSVLDKLLRLGEGRMVKRLKRVADYVNTLSDDIEKLTDAELRAKTDEFKKRVADGESLDDLLPEAFAVAREAAWRVLDQRHVRRAGDGRRRAALRQRRRDEDR